MALQPETITVDIEAAVIGGAASVSAAVTMVIAQVKNKAIQKIGAAAVPGLNWVQIAGFFSSGIIAVAGKNGMKVTLKLGVETVTKVQQGKKYTFEKYCIDDVIVDVY